MNTHTHTNSKRFLIDVLNIGSKFSKPYSPKLVPFSFRKHQLIVDTVAHRTSTQKFAIPLGLLSPVILKCNFVDSAFFPL